MNNTTDNGLLRIDLHVHTTYSYDGFTTVEQLATACQRRGLNALAITDHDSLEGALRCEKSLPFKVIVGEEVTTTSGHLIGLFLKRWIPPGRSIAETIDRIHDQGGIAYLPHPFDTVRSGRISAAEIEEIVRQVDLVEVFNARNFFDDANRKAHALAESHAIARVAASDAHIPHEIGRSSMEMQPFSSPEGFIASVNQASLTTAKTPLTVRAWIKLMKVWKGVP